LPTENRDPVSEFALGHIPTARFFDIDDISDHRSALPHMVPPVEKFMSRVRALGVGDGHQIVVYDSKGLFSAARVWWLFRMMGHDKIAVLDGGLPKWVADGNPLDKAKPVIRDRHMTVQPQPHMVRDVTQVAYASKLLDHEIIDARAAARFRGEAPEPRQGLRAGHIPGSKNLPFTQLLNGDHTMKTTAEMADEFQKAGVNLSKPVITTCGSGVTAAVLSLALERMGKIDHALYDGSWTEWGQFPTLNVATGDS
jgi:thiosulfate/3-mercaptopyruvate sulfurtransferase